MLLFYGGPSWACKYSSDGRVVTCWRSCYTLCTLAASLYTLLAIIPDASSFQCVYTVHTLTDTQLHSTYCNAICRDCLPLLLPNQVVFVVRFHVKVILWSCCAVFCDARICSLSLITLKDQCLFWQSFLKLLYSLYLSSSRPLYDPLTDECTAMTKVQKPR